MNFPFGKTHPRLMLAAIVAFVISLLTSYVIIVLTIQKTYSIPSNEANYNSSTQGGDALGDAESFLHVGVFVGPRPGATNVSLDTVIYVDQSRPVSVDLHVSPEIPIRQIKEEHVGIASRVTILCPAELLQPDTTYNVSGSIMGLSAWWTFTTGSSVISQPENEFLFSPYELWGFSIITASIATSIFVVIVRRSHNQQRIVANRLSIERSSFTSFATKTK